MKAGINRADIAIATACTLLAFMASTTEFTRPDAGCPILCAQPGPRGWTQARFWVEWGTNPIMSLQLAEKARCFEGARLQPCHKVRKMSAALAAEGCFSLRRFQWEDDPFPSIGVKFFFFNSNIAPALKTEASAASTCHRVLETSSMLSEGLMGILLNNVNPSRISGARYPITARVNSN